MRPKKVTIQGLDYICVKSNFKVGHRGGILQKMTPSTVSDPCIGPNINKIEENKKILQCYNGNHAETKLMTLSKTI